MNSNFKDFTGQFKVANSTSTYKTAQSSAWRGAVYYNSRYMHGQTVSAVYTVTSVSGTNP